MSQGAPRGFAFSAKELAVVVDQYYHEKFSEATRYMSMLFQNQGELEDGLKCSQENGIEKISIQDRIQLFGDNEIDFSANKGLIKYILEYFTDFCVLGVFILSLVTFVLRLIFELGQWEQYFIVWVLLCILVLYLAKSNHLNQEYEIASLDHFNFVSQVIVRRDEEEVEIKSTELVVGDVMELYEGCMVPADAILLKCSKLKVNEYIINGTNEPVGKLTAAKALANYGNPYYKNEENPVLYGGSKIVEGECLAVVVAVGDYSTRSKLKGVIYESGNSGLASQYHLQMYLIIDDIGKYVLVLGAVIGIFQLLRFFVSAYNADQLKSLNNYAHFIDFALTFLALMLAGIREDFSNTINMGKKCLQHHLLEHKCILAHHPTSITKLEDMDTLCIDESSLPKINARGVVAYLENIGIKCVLFTSVNQQPEAINFGIDNGFIIDVDQYEVTRASDIQKFFAGDKIEQRFNKLKVVLGCTDPEIKHTIINEFEKQGCKLGYISHDPLDHELVERVDVGIATKESDITLSQASKITLLKSELQNLAEAIVSIEYIPSNVEKVLYYCVSFIAGVIAVQILGFICFGYTVLSPALILFMVVCVSTMPMQEMFLSDFEKPKYNYIRGIPEHGSEIFKSNLIKQTIFQGVAQAVIAIGLLVIGHPLELIGVGLQFSVEDGGEQIEAEASNETNDATKLADQPRMPITSWWMQPQENMSMVFCTFVFMQVFNIMNARAIGVEEPSLVSNLKPRILQKYIVLTIVTFVFVDMIGNYFGLSQLAFNDLGMSIVVAAIVQIFIGVVQRRMFDIKEGGENEVDPNEGKLKEE